MTTECMRPRTSHGLLGMLGATDGFSLIEAVVASFIVVLVFAGFGKGLGVAYLGSKDNAAAQEATAIGVEQLEFARSLDFDHIAMSSMVHDAPLIDPDRGVLVGGEAGLDRDEDLIVDPVGGLLGPTEIQTVDGVIYSIWRYVTDASQGLRRVLVLVEWDGGADAASHRTSTLISEAGTR